MILQGDAKYMNSFGNAANERSYDSESSWQRSSASSLATTSGREDKWFYFFLLLRDWLQLVCKETMLAYRPPKLQAFWLLPRLSDWLLHLCKPFKDLKVVCLYRHTIICNHQGQGCSGALKLNLAWQSNSQQKPHATAEFTVEPLQASSYSWVSWHSLPVLCWSNLQLSKAPNVYANECRKVDRLQKRTNKFACHGRLKFSPVG